MKWFDKKGQLKTHLDRKYLIDWSRQAPSKGAQAVKDLLQKHYFFWTWFEEYRLPRTLLKVDFLTPSGKIAIEFHGIQHEKFVPFMHGSRNGFRAHIKRDMEKLEILELNGFRLVEIYESDVEDLSKKWLEDRFGIV